MKIYVDNMWRVWLSYKYLTGYGISIKTINHWKERNIGKRKYIDNRAYINYDTIPEPTRKILPNKACLRLDAREEHRENRQQYFFHEMEKAYNSIDVARWRREIRKVTDKKSEKGRLSTEEIDRFARKATVFEKILSIYHGNRGDLVPLHKAYLELFLDGFSMKNRFCMALKQAKEKGILSIAVNYSCLNYRHEKYEKQKLYAASILSDGKAYYLTDAYKIFSDLCKDAGIDVPCYKWFWEFYKNHKNDIDVGRLGKSKWEDKNRNYAKIIPAEYSGDQWQMAAGH